MSHDHEAPDPHAAYRNAVAAEESAQANRALHQHFQERSYGLALQVRARDVRIAELEAELAEVRHSLDDHLLRAMSAAAHVTPVEDAPDPWAEGAAPTDDVVLDGLDGYRQRHPHDTPPIEGAAD